MSIFNSGPAHFPNNEPEELKLFQDHLQNRTQYVSYDKTNTDMYRISVLYILVCLKSLYWALFYLSYILMIYTTPVNCLR